MQGRHIEGPLQALDQKKNKLKTPNKIRQKTHKLYKFIQ